MSSEATSFPWEPAIARRALAAGLELPSSSVSALARHARGVLAANERLHLTAITVPDEFVERHIGEAFEGAALLHSSTQGVLLDLGSGNGYPGIPLAIARPGLTPILVDASNKKSDFLREALSAALCGRGRVLERHVARAADLFDVAEIAVLATRAMGGWERIVPKLFPRLTHDGIVLLWATREAETILRRVAWREFRVTALRALPSRERSVIYSLQRDH